MRVENSFIGASGVGATTERRLWEAGITHWDDFHRDAPGVGETRARNVESFIADARAALDDGDSRFFANRFPNDDRWRLYETFREDACFFDIETTGLSADTDRVTTVSAHQGGETTTLVAGDDLTRERVTDLLDAPLLVTYNGRRFDVPFLESAFDLSLDAPQFDLLSPCHRLGLTGGLKAVEREVGIERDRPDISGRDAVRLWLEYERGDDAALDTLVSYNREDAVNLVALADTLVGTLHDDVFV